MIKHAKQRNRSSTLEHVNQDGFTYAAIGAIAGGILLIINWIWQGYLDLTPGAAEILHQADHPAYYINEFMLVISTLGIILGLFALNDLVKIRTTGFTWQIGIYLSILGLGLFALGLSGFILHGLLNFTPILHIVTVITGIGNVAMYLGAFPLGLVLLWREYIPRLSAILFILQAPVVISYMFGVFNLNTLTAGILIGGMYGGAWISFGFHLWKISKEVNAEVQG